MIWFQSDSVSNGVATEAPNDDEVMVLEEPEQPEFIYMHNFVSQPQQGENGAELPIGNIQHASNGVGHHVQVQLPDGLRLVPMEQLLRNDLIVS
jgi:hypothetical protein